MSRTRSILNWLAIGTLVVAAGFMFVKQNVDPQLTRFIKDNIDQQLTDTNFFATLRNARFIEGVGFEVYDLKIHHVDRPTETAFHATQLTVNSATTLTQLLARKVKPTSIRLEHAILNVNRDRSGKLNIDRLLQAFSNTEQNEPIIPVSLRSCSLNFTDQFQPLGSASKFPRNVQLSLRDINLDLNTVTHQQRELIKIYGSAKGDEIPQINFTSFVDREQRRWMANLDQIRIHVTDQWLKYLPAEHKKIHELVRGITADVDAKVQIEGAFDTQQSPRFKIGAQVENLALRNNYLPLPIHQTRARLNIDNDGIEVINAVGYMGESSFNFNAIKSGLTETRSWNIAGWIKNLDFKSKLLEPFPNGCGKFCHDFSPHGTSDIQFNIAQDSRGNIKRDVQVQLTDMSFEFFKFPYRVNNCVGTVHFTDDRVNYHVQGSEHDQVIEFKGRINNPGPNCTYVSDIKTLGGLPIDNKLLTAIDAVPELSRAFRPFRASGFISCSGRIEKTTSKSTKRRKTFDIQLIDCDCRHEKFNYPVHHINGMVRFRNDEILFEKITGRNTGAQVACNGVWNDIDGLNLNFLCNEVPLDDRLRTALTPNIRDIWDGFRPSGSVDVSRVTLALPAGSREVDVRIESNLSSENDTSTNAVSIFPVWFPYKLNDLSGTISIGGGSIGLRNVKAKHGRTWVTFGGGGNYSPKSWAVQFQRLLVGSLRVDEDLLSALPKSLQSSVRALKFGGQLNMNGEIRLGGENAETVVATNSTTNGSAPIQQVSYEPTHSTNIGWDLRLDMEQAKMQLGLPLENIFGSVSLIGIHDGTSSRCKGGLEIESLTLNNVQITNLKGPIWIDDLQSRAGRFANTKDTTPTPIVGQTMNGQIEIDGWVSHEGAQPFFVQSSLNNVQLTEAAAELAPQFRDISGTGHAMIRLGGNVNETHSIKGDGNIRLRNAAIYQLPVMLALLKILKVKEATRTAFDTGNIDFTVAGDQFDLERIELLGDAISLIGQGTLNLNRQIDLNFYTVMGRNRLNIPILSRLYRASSQRILWINVIGSLDRPETFGEVLPELNERLQKLFQPPANNGNTNLENLFREP